MDREERGGSSGAITGAITGALAMYFLDPGRGRRRRAMFRDKIVHFGHRFRRDAAVIAVDFYNRAKGVVAEARSSLRAGQVPDDIVKERVRSALGRAVSHPHSVQVDVDNGRVTLSGFILESEAPVAMAVAGTVRGVKNLEDRLERGRRPEEIPSLQGGKLRKAWKPDLFQTNQAPATRFLVGLAGAALVRNGLQRGGILGTASTFGGAVMLTRAVTNMDIAKLFGTSEENVFQVNKTIEVHAPVEEIFNFWRKLENFPRFMEGIQDVQRLDDIRSKWTAKGPVGIPVTWTARVTSVVPNQRIGWISEQGSAVINSGHVFFQPVDENTTRVQVHIAYCPPLGGVGHAVSTLFLADPKHRLDADLLRLKSLLEEGKTTAKGHEIVREEVESVQAEVPEQIAGMQS